MIKYGLSAIAVSLIWFFARVYFGIPAVPVFEGDFQSPDRMAAILGVAGVVVAGIGAVQLLNDG